MKADRESNRLPLRAGAMLLLAIAVVFIGLGWHSAATSGDDPAADLADAAASASATAPAPATTAPSSTKATSAPTGTPTADVSDVGPMCVLNAGLTTGLANKVSDALKEAGFTVSGASNLSTSSIDENTIFYDAGKEAAARTVAESVPGGASLEPRPAVFTKCPGELAVVVISE